MMTSPFTFVKHWFAKNGHFTAATTYRQREFIEVAEPESLSIHQADTQFYQAMLDLDVSTSMVCALNTLSLPQKLVLDVVRSSLSEKEYRLGAVPRLPTIIPKLLRSLRDPDASARDYVDIINKDPVLSAGVLKLANSAYFNPTTHRIDNIEYAVVKLGIEGLRSVLSAAVMQPLVQRKTDHFNHFGQRLWEHSLAVAVACERLAITQGLEPYKAYLLGLVHDVGKITLFSELSKQFRLNSPAESPPAEAFLPVLKEKSNSLSAAIALDWELPKEICTALQQQVELTAGSQIGAYAHLLFQANLACEAFAVTKYCVEHSIDLSTVSQQLLIPPAIFSDLDRLSVQTH